MAKLHIDRETAAYGEKVSSMERARTLRKQIEIKQKPVSAPLISGEDKDKEKYNDKYKYNDNDISFIPEPGPQGLTAEKKETHPSLEEIVQYAQDTHLTVDEQHFFDHYEAYREAPHEGSESRPAGLGEKRARGPPSPAAPSASDNFRQAMELLRIKEAKQV